MEQASFSRRRFLATTAGVALAGSGSFAGAAQAAGAKTLRIAAGEADGPKGTMDPALSTADPDAARISLAFERLVILDDTFTPKPQLAKSWEANAAADVWTFHLHSGIKFQDGSPFTARDVVYSYKRLLDPATASPAASSLSVLDPAGIEAVDDQTVRFKLKSVVVEFPSLIANRFTYILKEGQPADQIRTQGIGTGPFKVQHFVPGEDPSDKVLFIIDDDICTRCALCVDRCPTGVIILGRAGAPDKSGDPHVRTNSHGYAYGMRF